MQENKQYVVNIYKQKYDIYIGRAKKNEAPNKWGNPFEIGKDGTREDVIHKHKVMLYKNKALLSQVHELKDKVLGCFCHPKACHGDTLHELANNPELVKQLLLALEEGKTVMEVKKENEQLVLF